MINTSFVYYWSGSGQNIHSNLSKKMIVVKNSFAKNLLKSQISVELLLILLLIKTQKVYGVLGHFQYIDFAIFFNFTSVFQVVDVNFLLEQCVAAFQTLQVLALFEFPTLTTSKT